MSTIYRVFVITFVRKSEKIILTVERILIQNAVDINDREFVPHHGMGPFTVQIQASGHQKSLF